MTKLKDLPCGTLLISGNGDKGLYSNDNSPIFIMKLNDKKAEVLWQGTNRYKSFMKTLIAKQQNGTLEENRDYVLPENVGMALPSSLLDTNDDLEDELVDELEEATNTYLYSAEDAKAYLADSDTDNSEKDAMDNYEENEPQHNTDKKDDTKFYVNLSCFTEEGNEENSYLNVLLSKEYDRIGWDCWRNSVATDDYIVFLSDRNDYTNDAGHAIYKVVFTKDEYENIKNLANDSVQRNGLPLLPDFNPENPIFEFIYPKVSADVGKTKTVTYDTSNSKNEPTFMVRLINSYSGYLNLIHKSTAVDSGWYGIDMGDWVLCLADANERNGKAIIRFTPTEYNDIRTRVQDNPEYEKLSWRLPKYDPDDKRFIFD